VVAIQQQRIVMSPADGNWICRRHPPILRPRNVARITWRRTRNPHVFLERNEIDEAQHHRRHDQRTNLWFVQLDLGKAFNAREEQAQHCSEGGAHYCEPISVARREIGKGNALSTLGPQGGQLVAVQNRELAVVILSGKIGGINELAISPARLDIRSRNGLAHERLTPSHARHVSANFVIASSRVAQKPCDGRRGATTAPVMVQCQGRSSGTPPLALKIRPMSRPWASITSQSSGPHVPELRLLAWRRNRVGSLDSFVPYALLYWFGVLLFMDCSRPRRSVSYFELSLWIARRWLGTGKEIRS
jgi:hypothetical protein